MTKQYIIPKEVINQIGKQTLEESLLLLDVEKKALAKSIYEEVLKEWKKSWLSHTIEKDMFEEWLEQKLREMSNDV